jgi:hypothetical protein
MRTQMLAGTVIGLALSAAIAVPVLAHGQHTIIVNPALVAAGSNIVITGSGMEVGESYTISLVGMSGSVKLGEATAVARGTEGGFEAAFVVPPETLPGNYTVRATTATGEEATADLTVTPPSSQASSSPATMPMPSGAPHVLPRTKPAGVVAELAAGALLSAGLGLWLVVKRE